MPLSWNDIKTRATAFSKEWENEKSEDAEAKSFWDGFFNVFGISRRRVATFEHAVKTPQRPTPLSFGKGSGVLYYPENDTKMKGKTSDKEDRFTARFTALTPFSKIAEAVKFDTSDPAFAGEMIMEVSFSPVSGGTEVTYLFKNIPQGIKPEDNEKGTKSSLENLARYAEGLAAKNKKM